MIGAGAFRRFASIDRPRLTAAHRDRVAPAPTPRVPIAGPSPASCGADHSTRVLLALVETFSSHVPLLTRTMPGISIIPGSIGNAFASCVDELVPCIGLAKFRITVGIIKLDNVLHRFI